MGCKRRKGLSKRQLSRGARAQARERERRDRISQTFWNLDRVWAKWRTGYAPWDDYLRAGLKRSENALQAAYERKRRRD